MSALDTPGSHEYVPEVGWDCETLLTAELWATMQDWPYLSLTERGMRTPFDRAVDHAAQEMRDELEQARKDFPRK